MLAMFDFGFALVVIVVLVLGGAVRYYLRPSHGQHADPRGAATTVASLVARSQAVRSADPPPVPRPGNTHGLMCGYDNSPTETFFDPELPDAPAMIRPYLDDADHRRAALARMAARQPTERLQPVVLVSAA
ncbi:hypothetical protein [Actinokineospora sp.]|uniref:hypothetical protein n=1 Tax=Actinokineospora sp. TaxID=1872133 RepID=UPI0040384C6F